MATQLNTANVIWAAGESVPTQQRDKHAQADVLLVQKALKVKYPEFDYSSGPGLYGPLTIVQYAAFQRSLGYTGDDADGVPGIVSLTQLSAETGVFSIGPTPAPSTGKITWRDMTGWDLKGTFKSGDKACREYIRQALKILGWPETYWVTGMATIAARESASNAPSYQVNTTDLNAKNVPELFNGGRAPDGYKGQCSRGGWQCIPQTFCTYHVAGTSNSIYDPVANVAAAMNYIVHAYGVSTSGSNLTAKIQQADPNRPPKGY
jgi:hypothetical protein